MFFSFSLLISVYGQVDRLFQIDHGAISPSLTVKYSRNIFFRKFIHLSEEKASLSLLAQSYKLDCSFLFPILMLNLKTLNKVLWNSQCTKNCLTMPWIFLLMWNILKKHSIFVLGSNFETDQWSNGLSFIINRYPFKLQNQQNQKTVFSNF